MFITDSDGHRIACRCVELHAGDASVSGRASAFLSYLTVRVGFIITEVIRGLSGNETLADLNS